MKKRAITHHEHVSQYHNEHRMVPKGGERTISRHPDMTGPSHKHDIHPSEHIEPEVIRRHAQNPKTEPSKTIDHSKIMKAHPIKYDHNEMHRKATHVQHKPLEKHHIHMGFKKLDNGGPDAKRP